MNSSWNSLYEYHHLKNINGISFTPREIDVIACLLNGRGTKIISQLLSIGEKGIETHKSNIMRKLGCSSKENIIDFIEQSNKLSAFKQHYLTLLSQTIFERHLQQIFKLIASREHICSLVYEQDENNALLVAPLEKHLKLAGIKVISKEKENFKSLVSLIKHTEHQTLSYVIFLPSKSFIEKLHSNETQTSSEVSEVIQQSNQAKMKIIFLLQNKEEFASLYRDMCGIEYIGTQENKNYYFFVFELLQTMLFDDNLEKIILDFKKQFENLHVSLDNLPSSTQSLIRELPKNNNFLQFCISHISRIDNVRLFLGSALFLGASYLLLFTFNFHKPFTLVQTDTAHKLQSIRSDLPIPTDKTLLNRLKLLAQIEESLKGNEGIQTVALVGIGGAGKTTLARQYARQQKFPIVWEINAETNGSLMGSFEALAYALCQTEDEKSSLNSLKSLKDSEERREKIVFFVRGKLNSVLNWLLIFDNVEKFSDIQKFFPLDSATWGRGKIIITTRDSNVKNNNSVNGIILIGALEDKEKLDLFTNIISKGDKQQFTAVQKKEMKEFLGQLPPFPLDISTAGYYFKTTFISYGDYLDHIKEYNKDFEIVQKNLLQEASEYTKTRYGIITLSLDKLINTHKDFCDLLLFISLIDSQNIPKDLLRHYKNDVIVDNFIYHLKNYSLITSESSFCSIPSLSVHRSTQAISLEYLTKSLKLNRDSPVLHQIARTLEEYINKVIDEDNFSKMKALISHSKVFLNHSNLLTDMSKCAVQSELGEIYFYLGDYKKSVKLLEGSREILSQAREIDQAVAARTVEYLGNVYRVLGDYEKAKIFLEQSLAIYQKYFPNNYTRIGWALGHLGIVHREIGDYQEAKKLINRSLIMYVQTFSESHMRSCWALATLGTVNIELGDYTEARDSLEKSLSLYQKYYPENHIRIAWVLAHLGIAYRELGDYQRAKKLLEESLIVYKKYFFENHIEVVRALRNLGNVYTHLGDYKKAKNLIEQSIAACEKTYGKSHIDMELGLVALGELCFLEGSMDNGEELLKKAAELLHQKKHPTYFIPLEHLANLYAKKSTEAVKEGNFEASRNYTKQAIDYLQQSLKILKEYYPKQSPHILRIQSKLDTIKPSV